MREYKTGNHAICEAYREVLSDGGRPVPVLRWVDPILVPEFLVDALRDATPAELAEIADAVVCLRAGLRAVYADGPKRWFATVQTGAIRPAFADTRAEALHALAQAVLANAIIQAETERDADGNAVQVRTAEGDRLRALAQAVRGEGDK